MCSAWIDQTITTDRLRLRRPCADDASRIAHLVGDYEVSRNLGRVPHPYAEADAHAFLATLDDPLGTDGPFAVEHPDEGLVGMVGVHRSDQSPFLEVGYWYGRAYWGRGYASEALCAAVGWAGEAQGRRALVANHFADNPASGRVLEKAGFLYTGERKPVPCLARGEPVEGRMMVWLA